MDLTQFRVTDSTPYDECAALVGSEYTNIGDLIRHIQTGVYVHGRALGWDMDIVRERDGIAVVKAHDIKGYWSEDMGYRSIARMWAVVDTTTHNVLSYYAHLIVGYYDDEGNELREVIDVRRG